MSDRKPPVAPSSPSTPPGYTAPLVNALQSLQASWRWFITVGLLLLVLGLIASVHVLAATVFSVVFVGTLIVIAGVSQLVQAWRIKNWPGFLLWSFAGLLYTAAGVIAIINPITGAAALTLLLGATLIASGAMRLWLWFNNRSQQGWGWIATSGLITLLAGILIAAGWPANSLWLLGLLLALDLLFQGWTLLLLGLALRNSASK
ncbi:HdeD family acid-resistance protein [Kerstersia sp.]|uniref:HdeD family acid-resistance protein n=1 Tax=Kerstersia sp. TaxID=1930783 RepID=UPI003F90D3F3